MSRDGSLALPMQIFKRLGILSLWLAGFMLLLVGLKKNDPVLLSLRGPGNLMLCAASLAVALVLLWRGGWRGRAWTAKLLVLLWILPSLAMLYAMVDFASCKRRVLQMDSERAGRLGQHFIVGYTSFAEVARLADKGLIGGIYVTKHNVAGRSIEAVRAEITALQARRLAAHLPPLIVAADQEGGIVSHLSPLLPTLPSLSALAGLSPEIRARAAEEFGLAHGRALAALGVNLNFAPILDLRPVAGRNLFDLNTLIEQRAIASDPDIVADIARAYVQGLEASGVEATVKHFPGLGRVRGDTHLFDASLDAPLADLEASDWRPFRQVLAGSTAALMIGHVSLTAIDPDRPASHSKAVIDGLLRKGWNFDGLIVTDDLVMGAISKHDVCRAVVEALNAGADLLLVAYDGAQFYRLFACAAAADVKGELDAAMLENSEVRLRKFEDALPPINLSADSVHLAPRAGRGRNAS
jgi:beta-N-acetylhexosaminidase